MSDHGVLRNVRVHLRLSDAFAQSHCQSTVSFIWMLHWSLYFHLQVSLHDSCSRESKLISLHLKVLAFGRIIRNICVIIQLRFLFDARVPAGLWNLRCRSPILSNLSLSVVKSDESLFGYSWDLALDFFFQWWSSLPLVHWCICISLWWLRSRKSKKIDFWSGDRRRDFDVLWQHFLFYWLECLSLLLSFLFKNFQGWCEGDLFVCEVVGFGFQLSEFISDLSSELISTCPISYRSHVLSFSHGYFCIDHCLKILYILCKRVDAGQLIQLLDHRTFIIRTYSCVVHSTLHLFSQVFFRYELWLHSFNCEKWLSLVAQSCLLISSLFLVRL